MTHKEIYDDLLEQAHNSMEESKARSKSPYECYELHYIIGWLASTAATYKGKLDDSK